MPMAAGVIVAGAGPAGLAAAERLAMAGLRVRLMERMPSPARKFLLAGRGGLNLTHSEPIDAFLHRYGGARVFMQPVLARSSPAALRDWSAGLGEETFVGSSGRVFPKSFKASPLLRAWLRRLGALGVTLETGRRWAGWAPDGRPLFAGPDGAEVPEPADALLLALGGASWPKLGSDGGWVAAFRAAGVPVTDLAPANMGFEVPWSAFVRARFPGRPLKGIALEHAGITVRGEAVITADGIEGGAVYALSAALREAVRRDGFATVSLDLRPADSAPTLLARLARVPRRLSLSNRLRRGLALPPEAIALMHEADSRLAARPDDALVALVKSLPLTLTGFRPLVRAISTAGGVRLDAVDHRLMLVTRPGTFVAGEMLDWEAPTGGYLLQGVISTGHAAADGILDWLRERETAR
jgi:hypothetical protein